MKSLPILGGLQDESVNKKCYETFHGPLCHTPNCPLTRILGGEDSRQRYIPCYCYLTASLDVFFVGPVWWTSSTNSALFVVMPPVWVIILEEFALILAEK